MKNLTRSQQRRRKSVWKSYQTALACALFKHEVKQEECIQTIKSTNAIAGFISENKEASCSVLADMCSVKKHILHVKEMDEQDVVAEIKACKRGFQLFEKYMSCDDDVEDVLDDVGSDDLESDDCEDEDEELAASRRRSS